MFVLDNKIHSKETLSKYLPDIPILGEIPRINNDNIAKKFPEKKSRSPLSESVRIISSNLAFTLFNKKDKSHECKVILNTSSIKGEGKTILSVNLSSMLSSNNSKVLLGADLRNPQIHKYLGISKIVRPFWLSYKEGLDWKDNLIKNENLDILLSGTIPPNPTELLSSKKFEKFLQNAKNNYDYILIDSAPCLLVSDTIEISKFVDITLYVVRSNYSKINLCNYILENFKSNKLPKLNLVLNDVGSSNLYGYGYKYGYKYTIIMAMVMVMLRTKNKFLIK